MNTSRKSSRLLTAILAALLLTAPVSMSYAADEAGWSVDAAHSEINFSVNHFFTPVSGTFKEFEIDLDYNATDPEQSSVEAKIGVTSVDTGNERRDNHLRTADFFDAETFKSSSVSRVSENQLLAKGTLTIKDRSLEIELPITLLGQQEIPEQMQAMIGATQVAGFKAGIAIDRGDYDVGTGNWAATLVIGGQVDIEILIEAHQK